MLNIFVWLKRKGYDFGQKRLCPIIEDLRSLIILNNWNLKGNKNKFYTHIMYFSSYNKITSTNNLKTLEGARKKFE